MLVDGELMLVLEHRDCEALFFCQLGRRPDGALFFDTFGFFEICLHVKERETQMSITQNRYTLCFCLRTRCGARFSFLDFPIRVFFFRALATA